MDDEAFQTILKQQRMTEEERVRSVLIEELSKRDEQITTLIKELRKLALNNEMLLERIPSMPADNQEHLYKNHSLLRLSLVDTNETIKEIIEQLRNPKRTEP